MGWEANKAKARKCRDCQQTLHGTAGELREHATYCTRLSRLNLVVPGLVVGQDAAASFSRLSRLKDGGVDELERAADRRDQAQKQKRLKPRWG